MRDDGLLDVRADVLLPAVFVACSAATSVVLFAYSVGEIVGIMGTEGVVAVEAIDEVDDAVVAGAVDDVDTDDVAVVVVEDTVGMTFDVAGVDCCETQEPLSNASA